VGRSEFLDGPASPQVRLDQEPALVHGRPLPVRTLLCLDTSPGQGLSYVLETDTEGAASNFLVREFCGVAPFHSAHLSDLLCLGVDGQSERRSTSCGAARNGEDYFICDSIG
jgi:hypothetical protein